jgi:hypothetical protein
MARAPQSICNASHNRQLTTAGNPGGGARTRPLDPQATMRCAGNGRRPAAWHAKRRRAGGGEIVTGIDVVAPVTERGPEAGTAVLTVNGQAGRPDHVGGEAAGGGPRG